MWKLRYWIVLALGSIVAAPGHGKARIILAVVIFTVAVGFFCSVSLTRHPRVVCRACGGTGRHQGAMFFWADRACTTCAGSPRHRRRGVQVFFPDRRTWAERRAQQARRRPNAPR